MAGQLVASVLVDVASASGEGRQGSTYLSLAHALEFPGKLRLKKEQYLTVQPIYYPGFTIGGMPSRPGSLPPSRY